LVELVGEIFVAIGGFQMFNLNRDGKRLLIYGLALAVVGRLIHLIGVLIAYSGVYAFGYTPAGDIVGFIIWVVIYFILYYLVVISRFPGESPLAASGGYGGGYGGYGGPGSTPPPPPPSV
jgi:hypothetical protein